VELINSTKLYDFPDGLFEKMFWRQEQWVDGEFFIDKKGQIDFRHAAEPINPNFSESTLAEGKIQNISTRKLVENLRGSYTNIDKSPYQSPEKRSGNKIRLKDPRDSH
jgi:hypothetical protein